MRVTGGTIRGRRLKSPRGGTRPTTDLVRSAIFDALESQGADLSRVLDLYAGSGALGIEALSRGGGECDFIEHDRANAGIIRENLRLTGLEERGRVHQMPVERATTKLRRSYTLVLADPPYAAGEVAAILDRIARSHLVSESTALVWEQSSRSEAPEELGGLSLTWNRRYGDTQVSVYRSQSRPPDG